MKETLAYQLSRPLVVQRDLTEVPLPATVARLNAFMNNDSEPDRTPEHDAISFYMLNHAFGLLRGAVGMYQPLGDKQEVADLYFTEMATATQRAFYYLLLICTRESRHVHTSYNFPQKLENKFGHVIANFNESIRGSGSSASAAKLRNHPPEVPLGKFTESLVYTFYEGKFSGGYGGSAWGAVADCLHHFVTGTYSAEMMMDTVWTLCHNNGPIFNKGMLYSSYSGQLTAVLDVQRSGQIPNLIRDRVDGTHYLSHGLFEDRHTILWKKLVEHFPEEFNRFTDWHLVEDLGSVGSYEAYKQKQKDTYGLSKFHAEKVAKAVALEEAKKEALKKKFFFVNPNEKLKKITRSQLQKVAN